MPCARRSPVGKVYRSKRWAKRWAKGRPIRKVKGGYKISKGTVKLNEIDLRDLDAEAKRDQIYFGLGALTSNQILKRHGKESYTDGNQYFVSSTYLPVGEEPIEKAAAILEAVKMVLKGKPRLAAQVLKVAKREAKK